MKGSQSQNAFISFKARRKNDLRDEPQITEENFHYPYDVGASSNT